MTRAAIRAAEGPALEAFVLERVCGWVPMGDFWMGPEKVLGALPRVSRHDEACWRWVVPAVREHGFEMNLQSDLTLWYCELYKIVGDESGGWSATAPTPALAIVRAAALTVAEGGE